MESKEELNLLSESVDIAISQTKDQLASVGNIVSISIPLAAIAAAIGLQAFFKLLMLWIPTSFLFWILYLFWGVLSQLWKYIFTNTQSVIRKYNKLNKRQKQFGQDTINKLLAPLTYALVIIYVISIFILILAKSGIIASDNFSIWMPLTVTLLLLVILIGGLVLYRRLRSSDISSAVKLVSNPEKLIQFIQKHLFLTAIGVLLFCAFMIFIYFLSPTWALINTWNLYYSNAMWYKVLLVLVMQVLSFVLLVGYLTQQSARTELSNNLSKLSGIRLRLNQMQNLHEVSADQISSLKKQYYQTIKYRFQQERVLWFISVYVPILNEAFVNSKAN